MEIQEIRKRIDEADEQLVQAFAKRMRAASDIADYKREHGLPVWDPAREREVMAKQTKVVDGDMAMYVKLLYNTIFDISRATRVMSLKLPAEKPGCFIASGLFTYALDTTCASCDV